MTWLRISRRQCGCKPAGIFGGAGHDAECARGYDHLKTADDIACFRQMLMMWDENNRGRPMPFPPGDLTARMADGVTARAVELGLERL